MHFRVVAIPTLAMGKGKVAKGKVAKPANNDMDVKCNVHKMKTKAVHATVHAMKKVKKTKQWACLCPMVRRRLS